MVALVSTLPNSLLSNRAFGHEQIFFEDGKLPSNIGFFNDNTVREDRANLKKVPYQPGYDTGWNDCVMRKAAAKLDPAPLPYDLLGNVKTGAGQYNCQNWAAGVRRAYRALIKVPAVIEECCPTEAEKKK